MKLKAALLIALCALPQAALASAEDAPKTAVTWLGDTLFTARSAFYQANAKTGEKLLYVSDIDGDCAALRAALGKPKERGILIALQKPQQEVQFDGEAYSHYPVFMSGVNDMSAFASLVALDSRGQPALDVPGSAMDMLDKESVGQHGYVNVRKAADDGKLIGFFDVYYGGAASHRARRALGSFVAESCEIFSGNS